MKGINHLIVGGTTGYVAAQLFSTEPVASIYICGLGSLIVDIDAEKSLINKFIFPFSIKNVNITKVAIGFVAILTQIKLLQYFGFILLISVFSPKLVYRFSFLKGFKVLKYHRTILHDPLIGGFATVKIKL